ncbi:MAG: SCO family protein [Jatrophihabitantaceae bacterium]
MIRIRSAAAAVLLAAACLLAGCSGTSGAKPSAGPSQLNDRIGSAGPYQGAGLDPAQPRPSFTLTATDGQPFAFQQRTEGHPTLLYFGYTNCPDVCPLTMADIHAALMKLPASLQKQVYVVFVSTDVKRDTAAVLRRWLANFDGGVAATFVGLRGTQAQVDAAQAAAHVTVAEDAGQTHSAEVLLFGSDDYARVVYPQSTNEAQQIAHDLPLVAKA